MIHWRFGGWLDAGLPPRDHARDWLGPAELARLDGFRVAKRRDDWLIGRLNAKALVIDAIDYRYRVRVAPAGIEIARRPSGAPLVEIRDEVAAGVLPRPLPLALSNSHSHGHALCGAVWLDGFELGPPVLSVGVDLEWIESRSDAFVRDFLTAEERAYCDAARDPAERDLRVNLVWSAKEAVLKVVQRGLTVDTWWLSCVPAGDPETDWLGPLLTPVDGEWAPLAVTCDPRFPAHGLQFRVVWREIAGFVATLAVGTASGTGPGGA